jgi:hypothetical protein
MLNCLRIGQKPDFEKGIINIGVTANNSMASVREGTMPTERPPLVGEVSTNRRVVSATDLYGRILGYLNWSRCFFFEVIPQSYTRG